MKKNQSIDEILASWTRCINAGLANSIDPSCAHVNDEALQTIFQESELLMSLFESLGKEFEELAMHDSLAFLLANSEGLLLKKRCCRDMNTQLNILGIMEGLSFAEESCGTNAISLAGRMGKSVYTMPSHHYCDFLKSCYFYATPLVVNGAIVGYLAVCRLGKPVNTELMAIIELSAYKMVHEFKIKESGPVLPKCMETKLNERQLEILRFLAMGLPDKTIALKKGIALNTVKYHKKNIFKKLDVECSVQAIVKCLKLNLMSISEIK